MSGKETPLVRAFSYINRLAMDIADNFSVTVSKNNLDRVQAAVREITGRGFRGMSGPTELARSFYATLKRQPK